LNQVSGNFSFAAGNRAQANHPGTFAWAGGNTMPYASIFPNSFNVYASNGVSMDYSAQTAGSPRGTRYVYIGPINSGNTISTWTGARLTDGGIWSNASDKHRKTDFGDVNPRDVLERLAALPVRQWRYTNEDAGVKHLGPVAQDFQAAFGLGTDDTTIGTVDADGVALAAIQGLNLKLREELHRRDAENADLKARLDRLEKLLPKLTPTELPTRISP
jgi:trimeric autotransporter adhesin